MSIKCGQGQRGLWCNRNEGQVCPVDRLVLPVNRMSALADCSHPPRRPRTAGLGRSRQSFDVSGRAEWRRSLRVLQQRHRLRKSRHPQSRCIGGLLYPVEPRFRIDLNGFLLKQPAWPIYGKQKNLSKSVFICIASVANGRQTKRSKRARIRTKKAGQISCSLEST